MSNDKNIQGVNIAEVLSPTGVEAFTQLFEALGDKSEMIWLPEFQKKLADWVTTSAVEEVMFGWETPTPLYSDEGLPTFPVEGLPEVLREFVAGTAEELQIPMDLIAVLTLAALSAAQVGRTEVEVNPGWAEPVTLYALGLAESGSRKSNAVRRVTKPLVAIQKELAETTQAARLEATVQAKAAGMQVKAVEKKYEREPNQANLAELQQALLDLETATIPTPPGLFINDATPEAVLKELLENGERQAIFDAEGGGLSTMAGVRYANSPNIEILLKGHAGDAVNQSRVGAGKSTVERPILSIGILSQPATLKELCSVPGSKSRGLVDRFLIASPPDNLGFRNLNPEPVSEMVKNRYFDLIRGYVLGLWPVVQPVSLRLSEDAHTVLSEYRVYCEGQRSPGGLLRAMGGFGLKLEGSAVRLAALHHLAHYGAENAFRYPVSDVSMAWGVQVAQWSLEHYQYAIAAAGEVGDLADAERVLSWLQSRMEKTGEVSTREVQRNCRFATKEITEDALRVLMEHHYVRPAKERKSGGRPITTRWEVNPVLTDSDADIAA